MGQERRFWIGTTTLPRAGFSLTRARVHEVRADDADGPLLLTCPQIRRTTRRAEHVLDGPLAEGHVLHRRRVTRFELVGPDGVTVATFRQRALRPSRSWRPSWEVTADGVDPVVVTEDATFSTVKHLRAERRGDPTVSHHAPGLESTGYPHHALITLDPRTAPLPDLPMLLAALIAFRTHHPADLD